MFVELIDIIHIMIAIFLLVGGYIIPTKYIPVYLLILPYIVIDWNDRDGLCWVTKLGQMIKYKTLTPDPDNSMEDQFLNNILRRNGVYINNKEFTFILMVIIIASWGYAYYRFTKEYNITIIPDKLVQYIVMFVIVGWTVVTYSDKL